MRAVRIAQRHSFAADIGGHFAILAAIFLPAALMVAAIAIDLAMLSLEKREARAAVDLAAIIAAQNLPDPEKPARTILSINGYDAVSETEYGRMDIAEQEKAKARPRVRIEQGRYHRDAGAAPEKRFVANAAPSNAARVTLRKTGRYYFAARFFDPPVYEVSAVASAQGLAAFSVGSRLARIDGGVANQLLSALTGSSVSLSLLDYNALLDADIALFSYLDTLAATLDVTSGRYSDALASEPSLADAIGAMAQVSSREGSGAAAHALMRLKDAATAEAKAVELSRVIDLGPLAELAIGAAETQGMPARVRVLDLLQAHALVANGENLINLDLAGGAPGLAAITASLVVGEAMQSSPWLSVGIDGETVSNSQIRLKLVAELLGGGALKAASVRVPLYIEVARAEARLGDIRCPAGRAALAEVDILGRPGVADIWLGEADLAKRATRATPVEPARIVSAPGVTAFARARATIDNMSETRLTFTYADIEAGRLRSTATTDILESALTSLGRNLDLELDMLGLGLGAGALLRPAVTNAVATALGALDAPLASLLATLGVTLGEADIRVNGVRCDRSVLVQ